MHGETLDAANEELLDAVLGTYLAAGARDQARKRDELLARYPQIQAELKEFFADFDQVESLTAPLREVVQWSQRITSVEGAAAGAVDSRVAPDMGESFGDYELLGEVGRGGMGVVFQARQRSLNRVVALKMVRADRLATPAEVQRFRNEAEAAAHLDHPNIVPIYEVGEHHGQHYYSMKFAEGGSLAQLVPDILSDPRSAATLLIPLARAVHHAHQRGVLHRDLKPANVLISAIPMIADYGLARRIEQDSGLTNTGVVIGTPSYLAPEQAGVRAGSVTTTTDVYGLGAILYELLTGRPPFRGENALDTLDQVRSHPPLSPRKLNGRVPRYMDTICLKCLDKEPGKRYVSAAALADDLERFIDGRPIEARPACWPERLFKWVRRRPMLAVLLLVSVLSTTIFAGGLALHTVQLRHALDEVRDREHQMRLREREVMNRLYVSDLKLAHQFFWKNGDVEGMAERLHRHESEANEEDVRGFAWHYLNCLARGTGVARLNAHKGGALAVAFSPDGRWLASSGADGKVRIWNTRAWNEHKTLDGEVGAMKSLSFSADGRWLASSGKRRQVLLWETDSWRIRRGPEHNTDVQGVAFRPDGPGLVSWSGNVVLVSDPDTRKMIRRGIPAERFELLTVGLHGNVYVSDGAYLVLWNSQPEVVAALVSTDVRATALACSPTGEQLARAHYGEILLYKLPGRQATRVGGHLGLVRSLAFSPSGELLASADELGCVRLWDMAGTPRGFFKGHRGAVRGLSFAPDGKQLASAGIDGTVRVWDIQTRQDHDALRPALDTTGQLVATAEGLVATACRDGTVRLLEPGSWQERAVLRGHAGTVTSLAAAGSLIATTCHDGKLRLWDSRSGREQEFLSEQWAWPVALSSDGEYLALPTGAQIDVWEVKSRRKRTIHRRQSSPVRQLALSPDGKLLACVDEEGARVLDVETGKAREYVGMVQGILTLAFSPEGRLLAGAGNDSSAVALWEVGRPERPPHRIERRWGVGASVRLAFSPDGRRLAVGCQGDIVLLDVPERRAVRRLARGHAGQVTGLAFSPDGRFLLSGDEYGRIRRWNLATNRVSFPPSQPLGPVHGLAFSPDGKSLWTLSRDPAAEVTLPLLFGKPAQTVAEENTSASVRVWDVSTGERFGRQRATLPAPPLVEARHLALSGDGKQLAIGYTGGAIARRNLHSANDSPLLFTSKAERSYYEWCRAGHTLSNLLRPEFKREVRALAVSPDDATLAAADGDGRVRLWNQLTGEQGRLLGDESETTCLAFSPVSGLLALNRGPRIELWDTASGQRRQILGEHPHVCCLAFSADGSLLASAGRDWLIRVWDVKEGMLKGTLNGHTAAVSSLAFCPDGQTLASGGHDTTVRLWHLPTLQELYSLEGHRGHVHVVAFSPDGRMLASGGEWGVGVGEVYLWRARP